jgi:hypothetical protein
MNTETDYLKSIAEEIAANKRETQQHATKPNHHLLTETKRLEKAIIGHLAAIENFTQRDTFHFNTLSKLVNICDILFDIYETITPDVEELIDLVAAIREVIPNDIRPNLKLSKAFIAMQKPVIKESWDGQRGLMAQNGIDEKLIPIAAIPFLRFIEAKEILYWQDFTWLRGYQAKLAIMDWENADCNSKTEALMSLLIGRDFNDDRFYIYCKKYIQERTDKIAGKQKRLTEYALCEKLVLQDTQVGMPSYDAHANTVCTRLIKWIGEEMDFVETHEKERPWSKFEFKWNIEMIAFFFKLLWDHKVFGKLTLEKLSEQIAASCSSVGKDEFQATSIFSRFYVKDKEIIIAIEKLLQAMLEDVRRYLG